MHVQHFFDQSTSTLTYVIHDDRTKTGVVIDPVLDFDPRSGRTSEASCTEVARNIQAHGLTEDKGLSLRGARSGEAMTYHKHRDEQRDSISHRTS